MSGIRVIITEMNESYPEAFAGELQSSAKCDDVIRVNGADISGKDMYCSDEACADLHERLGGNDHPERGIHFIDTGNYHYLSRIFTSFIDEKYDLVLFDHHTDMQYGAFGDMLSCGSWAKEVLAHDDNLNSLTVFGPPAFEAEGEDVILDLAGKKICGRRFLGRGHDETFIEKDLPLYISFDKDILDPSVYVTNWDQGDMTVSEMKEALEKVSFERRIIGADICGGISMSDPLWNDADSEKNMKLDLYLFELTAGLMK